MATAPREQWEVLWRDLRYAFQILKQQPAARVAIAALALSIGAVGFGYGAIFPTLQQPDGKVAAGALDVIPTVSLWLWFACAHLASGLLVEAKKLIGYLPESPLVYECLSETEFLEFLGRLQGMEEKTLQARIRVLLETFEINNVRVPRISGYSKGMRQKILLSAALLHDPEVFLLDEPLSGLDVDTSILVKDLLAALVARGKTVLYSSHDSGVGAKRHRSRFSARFLYRFISGPNCHLSKECHFQPGPTSCDPC